MSWAYASQTRRDGGRIGFHGRTQVNRKGGFHGAASSRRFYTPLAACHPQAQDSAVPKAILHVAIAAALGALLAWVLWRWFGLAGIVFAAPGIGALLARPLINLVAETGYAGKSAAFAGLQGKYFAHRGNRIDISEDDDDARWLLVSDVRKVVPGLPRDEVLSRQFAERAGIVEGFTGFRIRADALAEYLQKASDTSSLKFRVWLDREVLGGSVNPRYVKSAAVRAAGQSNSNV
jgi:hypothetical protein